MAAGLVLAVFLAAASPSDPSSLQNGFGEAGQDQRPAVTQPGAAPSEVYSRLFRVGGDGAANTPRKQAGPAPLAKELVIEGRPQPKIVCGMTLIIVGSEADPAMVKPRPESGTQYPIRRMPPPACGQKK